MRHFVFKIEEDKQPVGMISIPDDTLMHRVPEGAIEVGESPLAQDKSGEFFEAWVLGGDGELTIDLEKAKEIRLKWLRDRREKFFQALDRRQFAAHMSGDKETVERIEKEKDGLRGFPDRIDWDSVKEVRECGHVLPPELV